MTTEVPDTTGAIQGRVVRTTEAPTLVEMRWIEVAPDVVIRGMFAKTDIAEGTVIEECCVVPIYPYSRHGNTIAIENYHFDWEVHDETGKKVVSSALAQGYGGVYNHASPGNMKYDRFLEEFRMVFYAARDIKAGEELTHDYQWSPYYAERRMKYVDRYLRPIDPPKEG